MDPRATSSSQRHEITESNTTNDEEWIALCAVTASTLMHYHNTWLCKEPHHNSSRTGGMLIHEILQGNEARCYADFRMNKDTFIELSNDLVNHYGLPVSRAMSRYEQVGMFLMMCAHGADNRIMQEMFNHSGETISRKFHEVLHALNNMAKDVIRPDENFSAGTGYNTPIHPRYLPYFKDCVGAIDGTHIKARVHAAKCIPYIGRKGYPTQNVIAVCDFNMCFTFAWAGWEGAAHDSRIFGEALRDRALNFPHPPENKYYLVDSGYSHMTGYMSPYKGSDIRYHLPDFRRAVGHRRRPRTQKERFNYLHSSCRMIIERTFGVWKARFAILANMPYYSNINSQRDIVIATMILHNYI